MIKHNRISYFTLLGLVAMLLNPLCSKGQLILPNDEFTWGAIKVYLNGDSAYYRKNKIKIIRKFNEVNRQIGNEVIEDTLLRELKEFNEKGYIEKITIFEDNETSDVYNFIYDKNVLIGVERDKAGELKYWQLNYNKNRLSKFECDYLGLDGFEVRFSFNLMGRINEADLMSKGILYENRKYKRRKGGTTVTCVNGANLVSGIYLFDDREVIKEYNYLIRDDVFGRRVFEYNLDGSIVADFTYIRVEDKWILNGCNFVEELSPLNRITHYYYGVHLFDLVEAFDLNSMLVTSERLNNKFGDGDKEFFSYELHE